MTDILEIKVGSLWVVDTAAGERPVEILDVLPRAIPPAVRYRDLGDDVPAMTSPGWFRCELEEQVLGEERFLVKKGSRIFRLPVMKDGA